MTAPFPAPAGLLTADQIEEARAEAFSIWHRQLCTRRQAIQAQEWAQHRLAVTVYTHRAGSAAARGDDAERKRCQAEARAAFGRCIRIDAEINTPNPRRTP